MDATPIITTISTTAATTPDPVLLASKLMPLGIALLLALIAIALIQICRRSKKPNKTDQLSEEAIIAIARAQAKTLRSNSLNQESIKN